MASKSCGNYIPAPKVTVVATMLAAGVSQGFGRFSYALAIPGMVRTSLHSIALAGTLGTVNVASYLLGSILVSLAATRFKPVTLMRIGLAGSALGLVLLTLAPNFTVLVIGMISAGLCGSFVWVPAPGIAGAAVESRHRGLAMGFTGAGIGLFVTLSSVIAHFTDHFHGTMSWRGLFGIEAVGAVLLFLLSFRFLKAPKDMVLPVERVKLGSLKRVPGWLGLTGAYSAFGLANAIVITFAVSTLERDASYSPTHAYLEFALMGFTSIFGGIIAGRISDVKGRTSVMIMNFLLMGSASLLIIVGKEPYTFLGMMLYGIPFSGVPNGVASYLGDYLPAVSLASAFGAVTIFFGIFQAIAPQLGGALAQSSNSFHSVYLVAVIASVLGMGSVATCRRSARGIKPQRSSVGD